MKKTIKENIHVEVYPYDRWGASTPEQLERDCESIKTAIKRHVDDVDGVYVVKDIKVVCEHCGSIWEDSFDGPEGPCCCDKAIEEWEKEKKKKGD